MFDVRGTTLRNVRNAHPSSASPGGANDIIIIIVIASFCQIPQLLHSRRLTCKSRSHSLVTTTTLPPSGLRHAEQGPALMLASGAGNVARPELARSLRRGFRDKEVGAHERRGPLLLVLSRQWGSVQSRPRCSE
ncbi:unnamed protein product [Lampetra fluviatilis]